MRFSGWCSDVGSSDRVDSDARPGDDGGALLAAAGGGGVGVGLGGVVAVGLEVRLELLDKLALVPASVAHLREVLGPRRTLAGGGVSDPADRKSVGEGKGVYERVSQGVRRSISK